MGQGEGGEQSACKTVVAGYPGGAWKIGAAPDLATKMAIFEEGFSSFFLLILR
tara:strand:- start:83 stop:241 length:159 start_codon:yes stop_codon:yes gene_type:complete